MTATGRLIGGCGLVVDSESDGRASIGYTLGALCDPENEASARVMEKAGMSREGCLRDCLAYAIVADSGAVPDSVH